jgi:hypothetical protein
MKQIDIRGILPAFPSVRNKPKDLAGWIWMAMVLNLGKRPSISPIHDFKSEQEYYLKHTYSSWSS